MASMRILLLLLYLLSINENVNGIRFLRKQYDTADDSDSLFDEGRTVVNKRQLNLQTYYNNVFYTKDAFNIYFMEHIVFLLQF